MVFNMNDIELGTRKLQKGGGTHILNVPAVAVRALNLHPGDAMRWSITQDGALRIEKEYGALPGPHLGGSNQVATGNTLEAGADVV